MNKIKIICTTIISLVFILTFTNSVFSATCCGSNGCFTGNCSFSGSSGGSWSPPPPTLSTTTLGWNTSLFATSTPCGARIAWGGLRARYGSNPYYSYAQSQNVRIYRKQNVTPTASQVWLSGATLIFTGRVDIVPLTTAVDRGAYSCPSNCNSYTAYSSNYGSGEYAFLYTDLTATPGNSYQYIVTPQTGGDVIAASTGNTRAVMADAPIYLGFGDSTFYPVAGTGRGWYSYEPQSPHGWSYKDTHSPPFSNGCPFVQNPGSNTSFGVPTGGQSTKLSDGSIGRIGGQTAELSCTNKFAYATARPDGSYRDYDSGSYNSDQAEIKSIYGQDSIKFPSLIGSYYYNPSDMSYYDIYKTGAVSYNFYRSICSEDLAYSYPDDCYLEKINSTTYTTQQIRSDFYSIDFGNSYVPPTGKAVNYYYMTSVNQYGAESWPYLFNQAYPLLTCRVECLDPNTVDPNRVFRFRNSVTEMGLGWNNTDNTLGQFTYSTTSPVQEWYIRPSNESKYANLVFKSDGRALSTSGSIDWSWTTFFNNIASYGDANFPGLVLSYQTITSYRGSVDLLSTSGNRINKTTLSSSDDAQKWCISPIKEDVYDEEYTQVIGQNLLGYTLINKKTQNPLMPILNRDGDFAPNILEGSLIWEDLMYWGYDSSGYYSPGYTGFHDIWSTESPLDQALSCTGPEGSTILSGSSTTYYKSNIFNGDCENGSNTESRLCINGVLSGTATSTSCTEYCVINSQNVSVGNYISYYRNATASNTADCNSATNKITYSCLANGVIQPSINSQFSSLTCTPYTSPTPIILQSARLVPNIQIQGQKCSATIQNPSEVPVSSTCAVYLDNGQTTTPYASGNPASVNPPPVDPGKDYQIVCKDNITTSVTATSKTLKCVLNPSAKEI